MRKRIIIYLCSGLAILLAGGVLGLRVSDEVVGKAQATDNCRQYFDKAVAAAEEASIKNYSDIRTAAARSSIAFSYVYRNCREFASR